MLNPNLETATPEKDTTGSRGGGGTKVVARDRTEVVTGERTKAVAGGGTKVGDGDGGAAFL